MLRRRSRRVLIFLKKIKKIKQLVSLKFTSFLKKNLNASQYFYCFPVVLHYSKHITITFLFVYKKQFVFHYRNSFIGCTLCNASFRMHVSPRSPQDQSLVSAAMSNDNVLYYENRATCTVWIPVYTVCTVDFSHTILLCFPTGWRPRVPWTKKGDGREGCTNGQAPRGILGRSR